MIIEEVQYKDLEFREFRRLTPHISGLFIIETKVVFCDKMKNNHLYIEDTHLNDSPLLYFKEREKFYVVLEQNFFNVWNGCEKEKIMHDYFTKMKHLKLRDILTLASL